MTVNTVRATMKAMPADADVPAPVGRRADRVVVIGCSAAGLFSAAAAVAAGASVTIVERDLLEHSTTARPGVPQGRQPHVFLYRGLLAAEQLLPGFRDDLLAAGAVAFDTGDLAWLGELGWSPQVAAYPVYSTTRPLLEALLRQRVLALPGVSLRDGSSVTGVRQDADGWCVTLAAGAASVVPAQSADGTRRPVGAGTTDVLNADLVVDASGRNSRLMHWLGGSWPERVRVTEVDARIGYASRLYRGSPDLGSNTGIVILATPAEPVGALALPVEDGQWIVLALGLGERRPTRDPEEFHALLAGLRDPAVAELVQRLEPVGDVVVHRQTGNRRRHYEDRADWPQGLLAVGDAFCAFNPVYGQGIAVAACEAVLLRNALLRSAGRAAGRPGASAAMDTRRLQRRFAGVTALPWSIATGQDLRFPTSDGSPTRWGALSNSWGMELGRLAGHGNERAAQTLSGVYHLMLPSHRLFHPALVAAAVRGRLLGLGPAVERPSGLPPLHARTATQHDATP